jgi:hypothetical protein
MVVDLVVCNLTTNELENIVHSSFKVHHPESLVHWYPFLMNSHTLFNVKVDKAASHTIMLLFLIRQYLSSIGMYRSGTADSTEFAGRSGEHVS